MQTPSTQRANAPDAFESQSDRTGDDVHDNVPLSALANIARSPGDVRSASKGGRNYAWTNTESLAALLAREGANTKEQREKAYVRAKECQRRLSSCRRICARGARAEEHTQPVLAHRLPQSERRYDSDAATSGDATWWVRR